MQKNLLCAFLLLVSLVFTFNTVSATSNETEDSVRTNLKADLSNDSFHIQSSNIERILDQWGGIRSGATYVRTTSSRTKIYQSKTTGYSKASSDFSKIGSGDVVAYPKSDGSITYVKNTSAGDVRLYRASARSNNAPTLSFGREKIRY